ncbi:MAG TPA: BBP7 family outer membrane beta-barrel protein [Gemmataceae bacterium]|jgi:hypothetical protein|nr:BBP7 family outer membrane beta-barrel protein [Gemmataceae bacterium]
MTVLLLPGISSFSSVSAQANGQAAPNASLGGVIVLSQDPTPPTPPTPPTAPAPSTVSPVPVASAAPTYASTDSPPLLSSGAATTPRTWFGAETILWFNSGSSAPRLAILGPPPTLNSVANTPTTFVPTAPGFIGLLSFGSVYRFGADNSIGSPFDDNVPTNFGVGGRFTFGAWLDDDEAFGVEGRYLMLARTSDSNNSGGGNGAPLGLSYLNAATGQPSAYTISQPQAITAQSRTFINTTPDVFVGLFTTTTTDGYSGGLSIRSSSQLQGGELVGVWNLSRAGAWHAEATAGVRFLEYDEILEIDSLVNQMHTDTIAYEPGLGLPPPINTPVVTMINSTTARDDRFETRNTFYGGEVGLRGEYGWGRFSISVDGDVSLGAMHETLSIGGATNATIATIAAPTTTTFLAGIPLTTNTGGPTTTTTTTSIRPGGLYAQPTNMGHYSRDAFAVLPEGIVKFNYRFTDRLTGNVGYTCLYMSSAARAGDQVNPVINPALLTSAAVTPPFQPLGHIVGSDAWVQGITLGLELKY